MLPLSKRLMTYVISIHAPSRERPGYMDRLNMPYNFNPRSLAGATLPARPLSQGQLHFNPRSLAGATTLNAHS